MSFITTATPTKSPSLPPSTSASTIPSQTDVPSSSPSNIPKLLQCVIADCARCGTALECYVSSGVRRLNRKTCRVMERKVCKRRSHTRCGQSCVGLPGEVTCFPGERWGSCPAEIGSRRRASRCHGGGIWRKGRCEAFYNGVVHNDDEPGMSNESLEKGRIRSYYGSGSSGGHAGNDDNPVDSGNSGNHGHEKGGRRKGGRGRGGNGHGRNGQPCSAALNSFASYKVCFAHNKLHSFECLQRMCSNGWCQCHGW